MFIYLAGKLTGKTDSERFLNTHLAIQYVVRLWKDGHEVYCPHMESLFIWDTLTSQEWIRRDLKIIERVDAVAFLPNWKNSVGARQEHAHAKKLKKKIIYL